MYHEALTKSPRVPARHYLGGALRKCGAKGKGKASNFYKGESLLYKRESPHERGAWMSSSPFHAGGERSLDRVDAFVSKASDFKVCTHFDGLGGEAHFDVLEKSLGDERGGE